MADPFKVPAPPRASAARVLWVDDEPKLLAGVALALRHRFDVRTAASGGEGLRLLADEGPFTVVVSDYRMPGMDGAEFLSRVRDAAPDAVRILLTGHLSLEGALAAVNRGFVFRLLAKPCPSETLVAAIEDAVEHSLLATAERELLLDRLDATSTQLLRAERLATLGTLASAIGHELNNVIVPFQGALEPIAARASAGLPPEEEDRATLERVAAHLATHARQLLHLGRPELPGAGPADLCAVVTGTLAMLRTAGVLRPLQVRLDVPARPLHVPLDRTRAEQVVLNLMKNAVDAVREVEGRRPTVEVGVGADPARGVVTCRVADNGCGIPERARADIFEPYFTTKPPDRGTGLGLFVVRQIVESAGGCIVARSEAGAGTTFSFELPLASPAAAGEAVA